MTIAEKITRAKADYDNVYEAGKQAQYDEFWDEFQASGTRTNYDEGFAGIGWTSKTFKPKYSIVPNTAYMIFRDNQAGIDLVDYFEKNGITVDFSQVTNARYAFYNAAFTHLGVLDFSKIVHAGELTGTFNWCGAKTVDLIKLSATQGSYSSTFTSWGALESITIEGSISCNGASFAQSTKLTKASITSIVNALSATTSGLAVTLSNTAVNKAFETTAGAGDGSTSAEWQSLIATKSNWTISLI